MIKYEVRYFGKAEVSDQDKRSLVDIYQKLSFTSDMAHLANAHDLKRKIKKAQNSAEVYQIVTLDILYAVIDILDLKNETEREILLKLFNWHPELMQDFFDNKSDLINKTTLDLDQAKLDENKSKTDKAKKRLKESLFLVPTQEAGGFSPAEFLMELITTNNKAFSCIIRNTESKIGLLARLVEYDLKNSTPCFCAILQDIFNTPQKSAVIAELKLIITAGVSAKQPTSAIRELLLDKPTPALIELFQDNPDLFVALYADNADNLKKIFRQIPNAVQFVKAGVMIEIYKNQNAFRNLVTKHRGLISEAILEASRNSENENGVDHETFEYILPYAKQLLQNYNAEKKNSDALAMRNLLAEPKLRNRLEFSKDTLQTMMADKDFGEENCRHISMSRNCWSKISGVVSQNQFIQARKTLEANRANIRDYVFNSAQISDEEAYLIRNDNSLLNELVPEKYYSSFWRPIKKILHDWMGWFKEQFETEPSKINTIYDRAQAEAKKISTEKQQQDEARNKSAQQEPIVELSSDENDLPEVWKQELPEIIEETRKIKRSGSPGDGQFAQVTAQSVADKQGNAGDKLAQQKPTDSSEVIEPKPTQGIVENQNMRIVERKEQDSESDGSSCDIFDLFDSSPSDAKNKDELSDEEKPKAQTFFSPEPIPGSDKDNTPYSTAPNTPQIQAVYSDTKSAQGTPLTQANYSGSETPANSTPLQTVNYSNRETPADQAEYSDIKSEPPSAQGTPLTQAQYSSANSTPLNGANYSDTESESEAETSPEPFVENNNIPRGRLNFNRAGTLFTPIKPKRSQSVGKNVQDDSQAEKPRKRSLSFS